MGRKLQILALNWKITPQFNPYIESKLKVIEYSNISCLKRLEDNFFTSVINKFEKHFNQWIRPAVLSAIIGVDKIFHRCLFHGCPLVRTFFNLYTTNSFSN